MRLQQDERLRCGDEFGHQPHESAESRTQVDELASDLEQSTDVLYAIFRGWRRSVFRKALLAPAADVPEIVALLDLYPAMTKRTPDFYADYAATEPC
jgi:hypothetical protein